jgi:hypothetical protein
MLDYANDTDGFYVGMSTGNRKSTGFDFDYTLARYGDFDKGRENLCAVMAELGLMVFPTMTDDALLHLKKSIEDLIAHETVEAFEGKQWVTHVEGMGTFIFSCGFPKGEAGLMFRVSQDHTNCHTDGNGCTNDTPNILINSTIS